MAFYYKGVWNLNIRGQIWKLGKLGKSWGLTFGIEHKHWSADVADGIRKLNVRVCLDVCCVCLRTYVCNVTNEKWNQPACWHHHWQLIWRLNDVLVIWSDWRKHEQQQGSNRRRLIHWNLWSVNWILKTKWGFGAQNNR